MENFEKQSNLPINSLENKNSEELKNIVENVDEKDVNAMREVAKNLGKIASKLTSETVKNYLKKVNETKDPNTMSEVAGNLWNDSLLDKMGDETDKFIKTASEWWDRNVMREVAKNLGKIASKVKGDVDAVKTFMKKVNELRDPNTMSEVAGNLWNDSLLDKIDGEADEFVKATSELWDRNIIFETSKNFGKVADKLADETVRIYMKKVNESKEPNTISEIAKNLRSESLVNKMGDEANEFVKAASELWKPLTMVEIAKNFMNESFVNKIKIETVKFYIKKALDKHFDECIREIAKNDELIKKLDETSKAMIKEYNPDNIINNANWN